jgi:hypothetical protein
LNPTKSEKIINKKNYIADNKQKSIQPIIDQLLKTVEDANINLSDLRDQPEEEIGRKLYITVRNLIKPGQKIYQEILENNIDLEEARIETARYRAEKSQEKMSMEALAHKILIRPNKEDYDPQAKREKQCRTHLYRED